MLALRAAIVLALLWAPLAEAQPFQRQGATAYGLVGWWRVLPGLSGGRLWYDLIGLNHGTLTSMGASAASGWASTARRGGDGELRFDGSNDKIVMPIATALQPPAMSLMLWVKGSTWGSSAGMLMGDNNAGGTIYHQMVVNGTGKLAVYFTAASGDAIVDTPATTTLTNGVWYHVAATYSAAVGLRTYLNCALDGSAAAKGTLTPSGAALTFGVDAASSTQWLTGAIDDARVYNRAVPQQELCTIMRESSLGEPRLLARAIPMGLLAPSGNTGSFLPFFQPQ